jgi:tetratricopeptide (TPR) repeat protein
MSRKDDIRRELDLVLNHKTFVKSPKAATFLKFIVEESLDGRGDRLNETVIAQDVFGKGADYDPSQKSLVRVSARRIRSMLLQYYSELPDAPLIKISIPKGQYNPVFEDHSEKSIFLNNSFAPDSQLTNSSAFKIHRKSWVFRILIAILISIFVSILTFSILHHPNFDHRFLLERDLSKIETPSENIATQISEYPFIAIPLFENKTGIERYDFLEIALQKKLIDDLSHYVFVKPVEFKSSFEAAFLQTDQPYDYAVSSLILSVEPELDIYIKLVDLKTADIVHERRIQLLTQAPDYIDTLTEIVSETSSHFSGRISQEKLNLIEQQISDGTLQLGDLEAYECILLSGKLLSGEFIRSKGPATYKQTYTCLEALLAQEPGNSTILAHLGAIIHVGAMSYEPIYEARAVNPDISSEEAIELMVRAIEINPNNFAAQHLLSEAYKNIGQRQAALKHAELAYIANPGSAGITAALSRRLAAEGEWERALVLIREAFGRNPTPPSTYYLTHFAHGVFTNNRKEIQYAANKLNELDHYYSEIFLFLTAVVNEDIDVMNKLRPLMITYASRSGDSTAMVRFIALHGNDDLYSRVEALFIEGGVFSENGQLISD